MSAAAARFKEYALLVRLDRPIGNLLLLWPTLWALWFAGAGSPAVKNVVIFVLGVVFMRAAGCAINDFADRDFDPHVKRTTRRPLARGAIEPWEAVMVFVVLALLSFGLVLLTNHLTVLLSVPAVIIAASYPFMKRWTHLPQLHLGVAFGWAIPMAYAAETGSLPPECWLLFIANIFWATVYDTMYAMVDRDDDVKIGVKSTAVLFGDADRVIIGILQFCFLATLLLAGHRAGLGHWFVLGVLGAGVLSAYQQYLIRHRERMPCFKAFLNNNWLGAVVFAGIVADFLSRA